MKNPKDTYSKHTHTERKASMRRQQQQQQQRVNNT